MSDEQESDDASDMQMSQSDVDQINEDMDMDDEGPQQNAEEGEVIADAPEEEEQTEDKDVDIEEEELPEENSDIGALSSPPPAEEEDMPPTPQPRLKITLRLPAQGASGGHQTIVSTPEETEDPPSRRETSRDEDIESEDSDSDDDAQSTRSTSVATTGTAGRALTARQAVLANVVDSSHVSLAETANPRKKKPLTEIEIALKREETARKRRNLTEKKLEDEKTETINRLLKKQSRAKGKRNALSTAEDRPTQASTSNAVDAEAEEVAGVEAPEPVMPTMYRWVSTTRTGGGKVESGTVDGGERKMVMSFSIPVTVFPSSGSPPSAPADAERRGQPPSQCDIQGCTERRKYRLVKDTGRGACGMGHLKLLEAQFA